MPDCVLPHFLRLILEQARAVEAFEKVVNVAKSVPGLLSQAGFASMNYIPVFALS